MQPIHLKFKTGFKSLLATYPLAGHRVMRAGARVHLGSIEYRLHSRSRFLIALCVVWLRVCLVQSLVKEFVEFFARVAVRVILVGDRFAQEFAERRPAAAKFVDE